MYKIGKRIFMSYRTADYKYLPSLGSFLESNQYCKEAVAFEPNLLCEPDEILPPRGLIELVVEIDDSICKADGFVFIASDDYFDSYFTQAEVMQWQRWKKNPVVYGAIRNESGDDAWDLNEVRLETLSEAMKNVLSGFAVNMHRGMRNPLIPLMGGKYANDYFVVPCDGCGEHSVINRSSVHWSIERSKPIPCPHCQQNQFTFAKGQKKRARYQFAREPVVQYRFKGAHLRPMEPTELHHLFYRNDLPLTQDGRPLFKEATLR
jgi:hypothetical protein